MCSTVVVQSNIFVLKQFSIVFLVASVKNSSDINAIFYELMKTDE